MKTVKPPIIMNESLATHFIMRRENLVILGWNLSFHMREKCFRFLCSTNPGVDSWSYETKIVGFRYNEDNRSNKLCEPRNIAYEGGRESLPPANVLLREMVWNNPGRRSHQLGHGVSSQVCSQQLRY